jgi:hypothetical protein
MAAIPRGAPIAPPQNIDATIAAQAQQQPSPDDEWKVISRTTTVPQTASDPNEWIVISEKPSAPAGQPSAQSQPQQQGGLLRNLAASTIDAFTGTLGMFAGPEGGEEMRALGYEPAPTPPPDTGVRGLNRALGYIGLNPDAVSANTPAEQYVRAAGTGATMLLAPELAAARGVGLLPKLISTGRAALLGATSGAGSKLGKDVGEAIAPEKYKPLAGMAGSAVGGLAGGVAPEVFLYGTSIPRNLIVGGLNKGKEWATGRGFTEPYAVATQRLAETIDPQRLSNKLADWRGAEPPSILDILDNRGRRLVRSAVSGGTDDAQNLAKSYAEQVAANLQGNTSTLARGLTPGEPRSADIVAEELKTRQSQQAQHDYAPLNQIKIQPSKEMVSALQGPEGRAAINRAYAAARANRDAQQMAELKDLQDVANEQGGGADPLTGRKRTIEQALSEVSAGTLDRVHIAMRGIASNLYEKAPDIARGYASRDTDINQVLKLSPDVTAARAPYRSLQAQRDALEAGREALLTPSDEYAATIARQSAIAPEARQAAGVGHRQAIVRGIQSPKAGATGFLNTLGSSTQDIENLGTTFGPETAANFQKGIRDEVQRANNARFIDPGSGSETFSRLQDAGVIDKLPLGGKLDFFKWALDWVKRGGALTDAEREAIARISMLPADRATVANLLGNRPPPNVRPVISPVPTTQTRSQAPRRPLTSEEALDRLK